MKFCPNCEKEKPLSEFYKNAGRSDGLTVYCGECHTAEGQKRSRDLRVKAFEKLGAICCHCGFDDARALQIDHVEGVQGRANRLAPSSLYKDVLADETGKYQLLCANCNRIRQCEEFQFSRSYGKDSDKSHLIRGRKPERSRAENSLNALNEFRSLAIAARRKKAEDRQMLRQLLTPKTVTL